MQVRIDEALLVDLVKWHILGLQDADTEHRINAGLQAKMDTLNKRALYSASKTAKNPAERERARQDYLDAAGVPEKFRW